MNSEFVFFGIAVPVSIGSEIGFSESLVEFWSANSLRFRPHWAKLVDSGCNNEVAIEGGTKGEELKVRIGIGGNAAKLAMREAYGFDLIVSCSG